ncbi:alpha/beta fold hydrolase [Patiriisocius marinus]|uniref:Homoserine O-acetyltransferase n=1 Tax=Patiriisocius marinus TaxID=1397112 RepID=A0A5J4J586_9FLAO|nr:alpha/beta fold hydrolase [Patiriisocius marinus]GER60971.1 homoserine O-acetyltransferase [Patiriisocius marinus]
MDKLKYISIPTYFTESGREITTNLSYQIFGRTLGDAPIVLVNHALTANSNVLGVSGWWNKIIGKEKCISTETYTVLAFNVPGNGFDTKAENIIEDYKNFTARDVAQLFLLGLQQLRINKVFAIIGGSTGGGIAWEMVAINQVVIEHLIPIASDWKSTDWVLANCHIQDSILNNSANPLFDARIHAMTLYRTPESLTEKFKRTEKEKGLYNVESWLNYHGNELTSRFQLSAYKLMNHLLKTVDITRGRGEFLEVATTISSSIHIITINSDLFFKPQENWKTYTYLKLLKDNVTISEINSIHGHDAFLIEYDQLSKILKPIFKTEKEVSK